MVGGLLEVVPRHVGEEHRDTSGAAVVHLPTMAEVHALDLVLRLGLATHNAVQVSTRIISCHKLLLFNRTD